MAKIGVLLIPFCLFYLPSDVYLGTLSFMRFIVFLYCVLFAVRLFAIGVKDFDYPHRLSRFGDIRPTVLQVLGHLQGRKRSCALFRVMGDTYTLQYCGEAMIVLLILSYIEEVGRRK